MKLMSLNKKLNRSLCSILEYMLYALSDKDVEISYDKDIDYFIVWFNNKQIYKFPAVQIYNKVDGLADYLSTIVGDFNYEKD